MNARGALGVLLGLVIAGVCGCAPVEEKTAVVDWISRPACSAAVDRTNTFAIQVFRAARDNAVSPESGTGCEQCVAPGACELVSTECRCTPPRVEAGDARAALEGLRFQKLDVDARYCIRVAQLEIPGNDVASEDVASDVVASDVVASDVVASEDAPGAGRPGRYACPDGFACERAFDDNAIRKNAHMCSLSDWAEFPPSVLIECHTCRGADATTLVAACMGARRVSGRICR